MVGCFQVDTVEYPGLAHREMLSSKVIKDAVASIVNTTLEVCLSVCLSVCWSACTASRVSVSFVVPRRGC